MSVIVHGPQGCGKTSVAPALARRFGCVVIVDDWNGKSRLPKKSLVLTSLNPCAMSPKHRAKAISFHEALTKL